VIDFRYHLVSIIAVFLALAVGLVVGSTALSGKAVEVLTEGQRLALHQNAALVQDRANLVNQLNAEQAFAQAAWPRLVPGLLTSDKVVLVEAPNADPGVTAGVITALKQAGATVTGEVVLSSTFLAIDGHNEDQLTSLAQSLATTAGVTLATQAQGSVSGQQAASKVLAASLLSGGGAGLTSADITSVLNEFSQAGYLSLANGTTISEQASQAVLVAPGGSPPQGGSQVLVALAVALRNATEHEGTVMVGGSDSAGSRSVIGAEIGVHQVSTVDNADSVTGQIMTVQALRLLLDGEAPGQYGIAPGAAPSPAPTPSATPTVTPSTHASSGAHK
jgi:hypothetical protein